MWWAQGSQTDPSQGSSGLQLQCSRKLASFFYPTHGPVLLLGICSLVLKLWQESHFLSLGLSFHTQEMGLIIPHQRVVVRVKLNSIYENVLDLAGVHPHVGLWVRRWGEDTTLGGLRQKKSGMSPLVVPHFSQYISKTLLDLPPFFDFTSLPHAHFTPVLWTFSLLLKDPWHSLPQGLCTGLSLWNAFPPDIGMVYSLL